MELILKSLVIVLLVPRSHGVMECNDSATSWVDTDMYLRYQLVAHRGDNSLTCIPAHGLQAYAEAVVNVNVFISHTWLTYPNLSYWLFCWFIHMISSMRPNKISIVAFPAIYVAMILFKSPYNIFSLHRGRCITINKNTIVRRCGIALVLFDNISVDRGMGLLPDTQNCCLRMRREFREHFPHDRCQLKSASYRSRRYARAVMHVGIANPWWRGKRSRHSRRMHNPQIYVSGKRPNFCYQGLLCCICILFQIVAFKAMRMGLRRGADYVLKVNTIVTFSGYNNYGSTFDIYSPRCIPRALSLGISPYRRM